ncbi:tetratricopeptide repeat protein [Thermoplasma volcanium]|nr:tetratricopeptide repeat protein [Thermoplasma volcanium]
MEKALTLQQMPDFIVSTIPKGQASYLVFGERSIGKKDVIDIVIKQLEKIGFRTGVEQVPSVGETYKNQTLNSIMDKITGKTEVRDKNTIIKEYDEFTRNNKEKIVIAVYGVEKLSMESKNLFLYMCRISRNRNVTLIGTYNADSTDEYDRFINLIASEDYINIIKIEKPTIEDIAFLVKKMGYKLPDDFVKEIARLTNYNIDSMKYALRYYQDLGVINDRKEINTVSFRYIPVPPTTELYYEKMINSLTDLEKNVAYLMVMLSNDIDVDSAAIILNRKRTEVLNIIRKLEDKGLVKFNGQVVGFYSDKIRRSVEKSMKTSDIAYMTSLIESSQLFMRMPPAQRMHILMKANKLDEIRDIIKEKGQSLVDGYNSVDEVIEDLEQLGNVFSEDSDVKKVLCHAYYLKGRFDKAISCYMDIKPDHDLDSMIDLSSIYSNMGKFEEAEKILEDAKNNFTDDYPQTIISYRIAALYYRMGRYKDTIDMLTPLLGKIDAENMSGVKAGILNILGNIDMTSYRYGDALKKYNEALEINRKLSNYAEISRNLNNIALIDVYTGKYDLAISILKELIETTYSTGDLVSRIYAIYNLSEIYYVIGKQEYAEGYIPLMMRILDVVSEKRVSFHIYRFLTMYYVGLLDFKMAKKYAELAIENAIMEDQKIMAIIFHKIINYVLTGEDPNIDTQEIDSTNFTDDYTSTFLIALAYYYRIIENQEMAKHYVDMAEEAAYKMKIPYVIVNASFHKAVILLSIGDLDGFRRHFERMQKPPTTIQFYDDSFEIFRSIYDGNFDAIKSSKYRIIEEDHVNGTLKGLMPVILNAFALYKFSGIPDDLHHLINVTPEPYSRLLALITNYH